MKILLLVDVKNVGKKGEVKEVSDGYAQNYLFKNKLAVQASKKSLEIRQDEIDDLKAQEIAKIEKAKKDKEVIENTIITLNMKSGKDGKMFGSVSTKQICDEIKKKINLEIDKRKVTTETINNFGVTIVEIELHKTVKVKLKVQVNPL